MNNKYESIQKQMSDLLQSFENMNNSNISEEIKNTLNRLHSIEQEWKSTLSKLKEHEREYSQLIKEVKIMRDSMKK